MNFPKTATALALAAAAACAAAAPTYRIKNLGTVPGGYASQALDLNDKGQIVGWTQVVPGESHAALWNPGQPVQSIGALPGDELSYAQSINEKGQIAGYSGTWQSPGAFVWNADTGMQALGELNPEHPYSIANAINDSGIVVGSSELSSGLPHGFVWSQQRGIRDLRPEMGIYEAYDINRKGQAVGYASVGASTLAVMVSPDGAVTDLGALATRNGKSFSYAKAISDNGNVAGYSATGLYSHAFFWTQAGGMVDIGVLPGGRYANATAVNDAGQVVGLGDATDISNTAFYWDAETGIVALSDLVDPNDPLKADTVFDAAQAINNKGQIVANGFYKGRYRAFLLTPVR